MKPRYYLPIDRLITHQTRCTYAFTCAHEAQALTSGLGAPRVVFSISHSLSTAMLPLLHALALAPILARAALDRGDLASVSDEKDHIHGMTVLAPTFRPGSGALVRSSIQARSPSSLSTLPTTTTSTLIGYAYHIQASDRNDSLVVYYHDLLPKTIRQWAKPSASHDPIRLHLGA